MYARGVVIIMLAEAPSAVNFQRVGIFVRHLIRQIRLFARSALFLEVKGPKIRKRFDVKKKGFCSVCSVFLKARKKRGVSD